MNKKKVLLISSILAFVVMVGVFFYFGSSSIKQIFEKFSHKEGDFSYTYDYSFSGSYTSYNGTIPFTGNVKAGVYYADKGLKERLKIDNISVYFKDIPSFAGKQDFAIIFSGWDIIQDEYKKYIKVGSMGNIENGKYKENMKSKDFKIGKYYLLDDTIVREKLKDFYDADVLIKSFQAIATSNPYYYVIKHNLLQKYKTLLTSEGFVKFVFIKNGNDYKVNPKLCNLLLLDDTISDCKNSLSKWYVNISWTSKNGLDILNWKLTTNIQLSFAYKNKTLSQIIYTNKAKLYKKYDLIFKNSDNTFIKLYKADIVTKNGDFVLKYERGKQDLIINANIQKDDFKLVGKYENGKGNFKLTGKDSAGTIDIENNVVNVDIKGTNDDKEYMYAKLDLNKYTLDFKFYVQKENIDTVIYFDKTDKFKLHINNKVDVNYSFKDKKGDFDLQDEKFAFKGNFDNSNGLSFTVDGYFVSKKLDYDAMKGSYYKDTKNTISMDFNYTDSKVDGKLIINNDITIDVSGIAGKNYNLKISVTSKKYGKQVNIYAKGEKGNGKITVDIGVKENPIFVLNYDIKDDLSYINIDGQLLMGFTQVSGKFTRKLDKNLNDSINLNLNIAGNKFVLNAKGKIKKGGLSFDVPKNYEKVKDQKLQILGIYYSLPNFDYKILNQSYKQFRTVFEKTYGLSIEKAAILGYGVFMMAILQSEIKGAEASAIDTQSKANLAIINTALLQYRSDNGEYPESIYSGKLKTYIDSVPVTNDGKKYFYRVLKNTGEEGFGFILAAKMNNPANCNLNVYSDQELENLLKENQYEVVYIKNLLNKQTNYKKGCYYVVIGF